MRELETENLALAVSRGAAYYGLVRLGRGVRVKGGIARAYYLEIDTGDRPELICVVPRDTAEGVVLQLAGHRFRLATNRPVQFPLYCSATRLGDAHGDVLTDREETSPLPPLQTVLKYGRKGRRELDVHITARLNEVGTLDISCETADKQHTYPLQFDLRGPAPEATASGPGGATITDSLLAAAKATLINAFDGSTKPQRVTRDLEELTGLPRNEWGLLMLRALADVLLEHPGYRTRTPEHELRWLNLTGFSLRPGFGAPGDEWRVRELWKLWHAGPVAGRHPQVAAEWWVCWRRAAGGLRAGHQQQLAGILLRELLPKGAARLGPGKRHAQEAIEMWRCLGAQERLAAKAKLRTLRTLLDAPDQLRDVHFWVIARLGARRLFHGPADAVVPAAQLEPLLHPLFELARRKRNARPRLLAVASLCQRSGVRNLDLGREPMKQAEAILKQGGAPKEWHDRLTRVTEASRDYSAEVIGDTLPLGLALDSSGGDGATD